MNPCFHPSRYAGLLALLLSVLFPLHSLGQGLRVPDGFEVTEFADSRLANDIFCLTIDPKGRVIISGRGYVRLLLDEDGDGKADRAIDLAGAPLDGAMGLFAEGDSLSAVGGGG